MTRSSRQLSIAALLAAVCAITASASAGDTSNIDLDEIGRRLAQWRASFVNLHVVWELRGLPETDEAVIEWPPAPTPETASLFARNEWSWADHGLDLLENWSYFYPDGSSEVHSIEVFNGPKGVVFRALFQKPPDRAEEFKTLQLRGLGTGKPTSSMNRAPVQGIYWPYVAAWLPELLSRWQFKLEDVENVAGEPCARVVATPDPTDADLIEVLWLDLNHDCLVRRHRSPPTARGRLGGDMVVDEFQRLDGGIWFPKQGRLQLGATPHENHMFIVTEAALNQPLDLPRFDPPRPAVGTVVDDHGRSYRHGITNAEAGDGADRGAHPRKMLSISGASPRAAWAMWPMTLAAASVVLLALGFWFSHQKKESRP